MCGSGGYDRDFYSQDSGGHTTSSSGFDYSSHARQALQRPVQVIHASKAHPTASPSPVRQRTGMNISPLRRLSCDTKNALVCALDVTGSMADSVFLFWDKLPLLYSELVDQKYLKNFSISFAAVGDVTCDSHPIQIADFLQDAKLDAALASFEQDRGGGPGELRESYEFIAYYYANCVDFSKKMERKPFIFFLADEAPREKLLKHDLTKVFGGEHADVSTSKVFEDLCAKYDAYVLCTPYRGGGFPGDDQIVRAQWQKYLPQGTLLVNEPKSVVDIILGVIAVRSGKRTIDKYIEDMAKRSQTTERQENVRAVLTTLIESLGA